MYLLLAMTWLKNFSLGVNFLSNNHSLTVSQQVDVIIRQLDF
jgi:hypothetical protein